MRFFTLPAFKDDAQFLMVFYFTGKISLRKGAIVKGRRERKARESFYLGLKCGRLVAYRSFCWSMPLANFRSSI